MADGGRQSIGEKRSYILPPFCIWILWPDWWCNLFDELVELLAKRVWLEAPSSWGSIRESLEPARRYEPTAVLSEPLYD
ncbi:hypothetical protein OUZ56_032067 [Daphnia magna]|uniref:Uncharacterized protein n=1 Tax=Daphnia magna TaxID=35525 RepID=A0ABQ9ZW26_9CRUS|nr:hypothetical protein OUZ56_032067 [Daphnia magna]